MEDDVGLHLFQYPQGGTEVVQVALVDLRLPCKVLDVLRCRRAVPSRYAVHFHSRVALPDIIGEIAPSRAGNSRDKCFFEFSFFHRYALTQGGLKRHARNELDFFRFERGVVREEESSLIELVRPGEMRFAVPVRPEGVEAEIPSGIEPGLDTVRLARGSD